MAQKKCVGCGIELQNKDANVVGYTPKEIKKNEDMYCQRCFQLNHYGKHSMNTLTRDDYRKEVNSLMDEVELAIAVFDIIDFEGSFDDEILDILREKESIVVINKLDLIPEEKHPSEVANWIKNRLEEESIVPLDIAIVSTKNGYGVNGIFKKIKHFYPDGVKAMVIGVTNVGKSSVINRLLGKRITTVSKYPGTTLKNNLNIIPLTNIGLYDTPGLIPKGRASDLLCECCAEKLIPSSEISRKTYKGEINKVIMIGNMLKFKILEDKEENIKPIFSIFAAKDVSFHVTNAERAIELEISNYFDLPCSLCNEEYKKNKKVKKFFKLNTGEELVFKGLGWISVKKGPLLLEVVIPEKIDTLVRKAFINPKR